MHAKHFKHKQDGRMAPGVCGHSSVPLSHSGNVATRIGLHAFGFVVCFKHPFARFVPFVMIFTFLTKFESVSSN